MKKILALVVCFALCFTCFGSALTTFAEDAATAADPAITIDGVEATPGSTVPVKVVGTNFSSVSVQVLKVTLGEGLSFDENEPVVGMDALGDNDGDYVINGQTVSFLQELNWSDSTVKDSFEIVIKVVVPETATAGTEYQITTITDAGNESTEASVPVADDNDTDAEVVVISEHTCSWEYSYEVVADGTTYGKCVTTASCECGESKTVAEIANSKISHAPVLEADLSLIFVLPTSVLTGYTNAYAVFEKDGFNNDSTTDTVEGYEGEEGKYWFTFQGISAKQMCNPIDCSIYATDANGNVVLIASEYDYTLTTYINAICDAYPSATEGSYTYVLRTLVADLANYGAAAQTYFSYNNSSEETLANYGIPTEYASTLVTEFTNSLEQTGVIFKRAPELENKVLVRIGFAKTDVSAYNDLVLTIDYKDVNGNSQQTIIEQADFNEDYADDGTAIWQVTFDGLVAAALDSAFEVTLTSASNPTEKIGWCRYSLETYAAQATAYASSYPAFEKLLPLVRTMITYGKAANAFFNF